MFLNSKYNPVTVLTFFYLLTSVPAIFLFSWDLKLAVFAVFNFIWFGLSSSLYYHRTLTHGALKLHPVSEIFFLIGSLVSLSGDPVKWVSIHRYHHAHSDAEDDTHSPKHGFFWAYYGWVMKHDPKIIEGLRDNNPDLTSRPLLRNWNNPLFEGLPHAVYLLLILYFGGWSYVFLSLLLPIFLSYNAHWMLIASLCHTPGLGKQPYSLGENSRNIWWLSFISFGESMHNNHHRFAKAINLNSKWYVLDLTSTTAKILIKLGLAHTATFVKYEEHKK